LVTDANWLVDMQIIFGGQKVKGQCYSRQWPKTFVNTVSQKLWIGNFA